MKTYQSFNSYIEGSIKENWDRPALTDYKGATLQYHDVARKIEKLHIIFEHSGVKKGDRIAVCGRNSAHWAVCFLATLTYGAVIVPVLHEFNAEQTHNIVNHSGAKLLFVGDVVAKSIDPAEMPGLEGIINLPDFSLHTSRTAELTYARENLNALFGRKYPMNFRARHVAYHTDEAEELAILNYTSGTTGFSKGVMVPYRAIWGNLDFFLRIIGSKIAPGSRLLCTLPMAHTYGMSAEFLFPFVHGCHLHYLTRLPSPSLIAEALAVVKPAIIFAVPLVVDKIIRKGIFPKIKGHHLIPLLWQMPVISGKVKQHANRLVTEIFGGNTYELVVGGAPLNQEIEEFLTSIGFPLTMIYGATECAPVITFSDKDDFVRGSCGLVADHMELRILSADPENVAGEVVTRGTNVMLGYYKDPKATAEAIDKDGWYHTGDLGTLSADGHLFIRGRIKNMLLGENGQNVYPEEIEDKLNSMPMVAESLVIQRDKKLVALVYPDIDEAKELGLCDANGEGDLHDVMASNLENLNSQLPRYCHVSDIELHDSEFEKTPKKSIKRYLYK